jgi:hypothetical protein
MQVLIEVSYTVSVNIIMFWSELKAKPSSSKDKHFKNDSQKCPFPYINLRFRIRSQSQFLILILWISGFSFLSHYVSIRKLKHKWKGSSLFVVCDCWIPLSAKLAATINWLSRNWGLCKTNMVYKRWIPKMLSIGQFRLHYCSVNEVKPHVDFFTFTWVFLFM